MPLLQETNQTNPNKTNNQTENCGFEKTNNLNKTNPNPKKEDSGIIKTIGQLLPLAPFVFEQFTGQKVPPMSGTIADIQTTLLQIQTGLQTVVNNQQSLNQRLITLETKLIEVKDNAVQHLSNLTHQFNSLRLTHTREKEKKEIEYNPHPNNQIEDY
jgi:hypothetical protein